MKNILLLLAILLSSCNPGDGVSVEPSSQTSGIIVAVLIIFGACYAYHVIKDDNQYRKK